MTKTIHVSDATHKRIRKEAYNKDKSIQDLVEEKLND